MAAASDPEKMTQLLELLGIHKKAPVVDPRIAQLENLLQEIAAAAANLPASNPKKDEVPSAIARLRDMGRKNLDKAIELSQGVLAFCRTAAP
jgi:hypothetical protein